MIKIEDSLYWILTMTFTLTFFIILERILDGSIISQTWILLPVFLIFTNNFVWNFITLINFQKFDKKDIGNKYKKI